VGEVARQRRAERNGGAAGREDARLDSPLGAQMRGVPRAGGAGGVQGRGRRCGGGAEGGGCGGRLPFVLSHFVGYNPFRSLARCHG
jgi:hypothetical protein